MANYCLKCPNSFYALLSTSSMFSIISQITPSIFMANYSPLSSENHRSLFVKPAKWGKQRAGGEALYALHYYTFNYQQCHPHNCFTMQRRRCCTFDSPGLASESEVYPGSFAERGNNAVGVVPFIPRHFIMVFHTEKAQHLRRWPSHYTRNPR